MVPDTEEDISITNGLSASELTVLGKIEKRSQQWQMAANHLRRIGP